MRQSSFGTGHQAEMDSPSLEIESGQDASKAGYSGLVDSSWRIVRRSKKTVQLACSPRNQTSASGQPDNHWDIGNSLSGWPSFWKFQEDRPYHPRSLFLWCTINTNFRAESSWDSNIREEPTMSLLNKMSQNINHRHDQTGSVIVSTIWKRSFRWR